MNPDYDEENEPFDKTFSDFLSIYATDGKGRGGYIELGW